MGKSNGPAGPNTSKSERNPQRIVLLAGDEHSEVKSVLAEYPGGDLEKVNVNEEVPSSLPSTPGSGWLSSGRTGWAGGGSYGAGGEAVAGPSPRLLGARRNGNPRSVTLPVRKLLVASSVELLHLPMVDP